MKRIAIIGALVSIFFLACIFIGQPGTGQLAAAPATGGAAASSPASAPAIPIGYDTTRLMAPLKADGTVDYLAAVNDKASKDVTKDNNAAIPLVEALDPDKLFGKSASQKVLDAIGAQRPDTPKYFKGFFEGNKPSAMASKSFYENATSQPWKSADNSEAAGWLKDNEPAFTTLIEASKKTKLYIPMVLAKPEDPLRAMAATDVGPILEAAGAMMVRATMALGDGHASEAWPDINAIYRLGALLAQEPSTSQREAGLEMIAMSLQTAQNAVTAPTLPRGMARSKLAVLKSAQFPAISDAAPVVEVARYMTLDSIARLARQMPAAAGNPVQAEKVVTAAGISRDEAQTAVLAKAFAALTPEAWVEILGAVNERYDKVAKALTLPTWGQRVAEQKKIDEETTATRAQLRRVRPMDTDDQALLAKWAKAYWLSTPLPTNQPGLVSDHEETMKDLLIVALAIEACKSDKGKYPSGLSELTADSTITTVTKTAKGSKTKTTKIPLYLTAKTMPMDFFTEKSDKPFQYKAQEGGYILYSVGENMTDDGGKDREHGGDDIVIRKT